MFHRKGALGEFIFVFLAWESGVSLHSEISLCGMGSVGVAYLLCMKVQNHPDIYFEVNTECSSDTVKP